MEEFTKRIMVSSLPAIFFLSGVIFLFHSSLTVAKATEIQNEAFILFLEELGRSDLISAIFLTLSYLWASIVFVLFVFLTLIGFGFLVFVHSLKKLDFKTVIVSQILLLTFVAVWTNLSPIMLSIGAACFLGILWLKGTFEPRKNDFTTSYSTITSSLGLMNVFIALSLLFTIHANIQTYEQTFSESSLKLVESFIPDASSMKEAQKEQIRRMTEGFEDALTEQYNAMPEESRAECRPMYEGLMQSMQNFEEESLQRIEEQSMEISEGELSQLFPFFGLMAKITPLITAISAYALLAILIPPVGMLLGVLYALMKRMERKV